MEMGGARVLRSLEGDQGEGGASMEKLKEKSGLNEAKFINSSGMS